MASGWGSETAYFDGECGGEQGVCFVAGYEIVMAGGLRLIEGRSNNS